VRSGERKVGLKRILLLRACASRLIVSDGVGGGTIISGLDCYLLGGCKDGVIPFRRIRSISLSRSGGPATAAA